jgi:glycosyltransferase involved in cell wall biosynthesis
MNKKHALIIIENSFLPLDTRVRYQAEALRDADWQVTVICPSPTVPYSTGNQSRKIGESVDLDGITVYYFPLTFAKKGVHNYLIEYLMAFISIGKYSWHVWKKNPFDMMHVCNPPDIFFPILLFFRILGVRIVFDHHDLFPEFIIGRYHGLTGKGFYLIARFMEFLTLRSANVIISTNNSYRKIACKRGKIDPNRVFVVRNGPKLEKFLPVSPSIELKRGFEYMVAYAGVMGHEDGMLELVRSIRYLINQLKRNDTLFILVGDGAVRNDVIAKAMTWGLTNYIVLPGMIHDRLVLRQYLCTADILLAPEPATPLNIVSSFVKIAEYMALGKPIIAYDLPESRYTAEDAAVFVAPGDFEGFGRAISDLLDEPGRRQQLGAMGRKKVLEHLSWEHQQVQLFKAYQKALSLSK